MTDSNSKTFVTIATSVVLLPLILLSSPNRVSAQLQPLPSGHKVASAPSPTPNSSLTTYIKTYKPKNSEEQAQLELLRQINNHQLSNNSIFRLLFAYTLPLSMEWKLKMYHWLLSLPLSEVTSSQLILGIFLLPLAGLILLSLFIALMYTLLFDGIPRILSKCSRKAEPKKLLQLTFPARTDKSAFATTELYRLLHNLGFDFIRQFGFIRA